MMRLPKLPLILAAALTASVILPWWQSR